MSSEVKVTIADRVGYLQLFPEREGKPFAINETTLASLENAIIQLEEKKDALALVWVVSESSRYFCVGADIKALQQLNAETIAGWVSNGHRVFNRLEDLPVPTVAYVEGYALGGGLELAMACDLIFAANSARFGQTEASLGFVAGWGGSWRLPRRVGEARAKELLYSGRILEAYDAYKLGLVQFCGEKS